MEEQIRKKVDALRAMLQQDGGDCEVVKIEGKTVTLALKGYVQESLRAEVDPDIVVERVENPAP